MTVTFQKATKEKARLRMAIVGPSSSGKTYTGLIFATALANGGKVAVVDTEHGSASKYADIFDFDRVELGTFAPQHYIDCIHAAEKSGYAVLLIDSLSHAWEGKGGVLEMHDNAVARQRVKNSFTAWRDVTPQHNDLIEAILQSDCHIIVTMRTKTEWVMEPNEKGKMAPRKVGLAPVQRKGMDYEFDIVADMDVEHTLVISKTRCTVVDGLVQKKPDAAWFEPIKHWLEDGAKPAPKKEEQSTETEAPKRAKPTEHWIEREDVRRAFWGWASKLGLSGGEIHEALGVEHVAEFNGNMRAAKAKIEAWVSDKAQAERDNAPPADKPVEDEPPF